MASGPEWPPSDDSGKEEREGNDDFFHRISRYKKALHMAGQTRGCKFADQSSNHHSKMALTNAAAIKGIGFMRFLSMKMAS